jgi:hypothetical protein
MLKEKISSAALLATLWAMSHEHLMMKFDRRLAGESL